MEYSVRVFVEGCVTVTIDADSVEEAKEKANEEVGEMDFGELSNIEWDAIDVEAEGGVNMRKTRFVIDTNEKTYEGYTDGTLWNGWECPWFTKEVADEMIRDFIKEGGEAKYDLEIDSYTFLGENWDSPDVFDGADVETEDGILHLYPIGAWCWIWDEV